MNVPPRMRAGQQLQRRLLYGALILAGGLLISAATWSVFRHGIESSTEGLPVLGTVPAFSLTGSDGQPVSRSSLAGNIWIADFIFTRCVGLCPRMSGQMARLQRALAHDGGNSVRLVSFSVDPTHDTPAVLRAYARRFRADNKRWFFVTGHRDALYALISGGFHLAVAQRSESENADGEGLITHSDRFVLVDRDLHIRGYYHGTDGGAVRRLLRDVATLRRQS
ncbi:MAG: SCO family protein [Candidatus Binatia bacterium]